MARRRSGKREKTPIRARTMPAARKSAKGKKARKHHPSLPPPLPMHPRKRIVRRSADAAPRQAPRSRARTAETIYDRDLDRNPANFRPLTPISFLERAAQVLPDHPAIVHGKRTFTYKEFYARSRRLASALAGRGIARGDTVAAMLANTPEMLEAHY